MAQESSANESLFYTPTWAIAFSCGVFILGSLLVERAVFFLGYVLKKYKLIALEEAFEKIKEELMLVGFISLALTVGQTAFSNICVPAKWTKVMLQCKKAENTIKLQLPPIRRHLASGASQQCKAGKEHFITSEGLHQLHILIFTLAVVHVLYSFITVALGTWKVHNWSAWEQRAKSKGELSAHDQRFARETTFVQMRATGIWKTNPFLAYVACFFRQFFNSVSETDYQTLRYGFITSHMPGNVAFDFHKYMLRSLQEDFKHVVGISLGLWGYALLVMLLNIDGWETHLWASLIPLILVLIIGTKLQRIITKMAVQIMKEHTVVAGIPLVKLSDELFWFKHPRLVLSCIHFVLFQNALEMSIFIWSQITLPKDPCLDKNGSYKLILRLLFGISAQVICGYVTLPVYALVSQMGSNIKNTVFEEHIQLAIKKWHKKAKRGQRDSNHGEGPSSPSAAADHLEAQNDAAATSAPIDSNDDNYTRDEEGIQRRMSYLEKISRNVQVGGVELKGAAYETLPK